MDWTAQTPFSDPGRHASLFDGVPVDPLAASAIARNLVSHYVMQRDALSPDTRGDINLRWVEAQLDADQQRHPDPLATPRPLAARLQGCARDYTLLTVAMLRHHGRPARSRVGFCRYSGPGYWYDDVVAEVREGDRWRRFSPGMLEADERLADMADGVDALFMSAGRMWQEIRAGRIDPATAGVFPGSPVSGEWFVQGAVLFELAHRFGDELLLWDGFGDMADPSGPTEAQTALADEVAALLLDADDNPSDAREAALEERYRSDPRLHPGDNIDCITPDDEHFVVDLATRKVTPR